MSRELKDFYGNVVSTYSIFKTISESNKELKGETEEEDEDIVIDVETKEYELLASEKYILSFIETRKEVVIALFNIMKLYKFEDIKSVREGDCSGSGHMSSRYEILSEVNLYDHTINVAIQAVEMLSANGTPKDLISISLIIAILHDFGKSPIISENFFEEKGQRHHKTGGIFAKHFLLDFLRKNKNSNINKQIIETISQTVYKHHDHDNEKNNVFINFLFDADIKARELELEVVRSKKINKGLFDEVSDARS